MAKRSQKKRINDLLTPYSKELSDAFMAAIADITSNARVGEITAALEKGDIEAALLAVNLDPAAFGPMDLAMAQAYQAGGALAVAAMPTVLDSAGSRVAVYFDVRNPVAEAYLKEHSSEFITHTVEEQRESIRTILKQGMAEGRNPKDLALDITGRIDPTTKARTGGVVGLSDPQAQYARNARLELAAGEQAAYKNYLKRSLRDKRFDTHVVKAIKDGTPISADLQRRMVQSYTNKMLKRRGDDIGLTEAMTAIHSAQDEAVRQVIDGDNAVTKKMITGIWRTARDKRVRDSHGAMEGQRRPQGKPFISGDGNKIMYPGDPSAKLSERIRCRCDREIHIDYMSLLKKRK